MLLPYGGSDLLCPTTEWWKPWSLAPKQRRELKGFQRSISPEVLLDIPLPCGLTEQLKYQPAKRWFHIQLKNKMVYDQYAGLRFHRLPTA